MHGWGDLGDELNRLSKKGRWVEMGQLIGDDVVEVFAVVGEPATIGARLVARYGDLMTRMTLYTPYELAPDVALQIGSDIREAAGR